MTAIVSPGYAPLEQYSNDGNQGPWSDIYALSGVIYRAVSGENPPDVVKRMKSDSVPHTLTAARARYSERFLKAIEWGMTLDEKMRPQSIAEWRDLFLGRAPITAFSRGTSINTPRPAAAATARAGELGSQGSKPAALRRATNGKTRSAGKRSWMLASGILLIVLALAAILWQPQQANVAEATYVASPVQSAAPSAPRIDSQNESRGERAPPLPAQPAERAEARQSAGFKGSGDPQLPPPIKKEFEAADRDGNGYLTYGEIRGKFPFIEKNFSQVDSDRDGRISAVEFMQLRTKQQSTKSAR